MKNLLLSIIIILFTHSCGKSDDSSSSDRDTASNDTDSETSTEGFQGKIDEDYSQNGKALLRTGRNFSVNYMHKISSSRFMIIGEASVMGQSSIGSILVDADGFQVSTETESPVDRQSFTNSTKPYVLKAQSDGSLVVGGQSSAESGIYRLTSKNSLDSSFGSSGKVSVTATEGIRGMRVLSNDDLLTFSSSGTTLKVSKFSVDGVVDSSFGSSGVNSYTLANNFTQKGSIELSDGSTLLFGYSNVSSNNKASIIKITSAGELDSSFGSSGEMYSTLSDSRYQAAVTDSNNAILLAGYYNDGSRTVGFIHKIDSDGNLSNSFATNGQFSSSTINDEYQYLYDIQILSDNSIIAVGSSEVDDGDDSDFLIIKLTEGGNLDTEFDDDGYLLYDVLGDWDEAFSIIAIGDDQFLIGGYATDYQNDYTGAIIKLK